MPKPTKRGVLRYMDKCRKIFLVFSPIGDGEKIIRKINEQTNISEYIRCLILQDIEKNGFEDYDPDE